MPKPEKDTQAALRAWKAKSNLSDEELQFFCEYTADLCNYFTCQPNSEGLKANLLMELDRYFSVRNKIAPEDMAMLNVDMLIASPINVGDDTDDRQAAMDFSKKFSYADKALWSLLITQNRATPPITFRKIDADYVRQEIQEIANEAYKTPLEEIVDNLQTLSMWRQPEQYGDHCRKIQPSEREPVRRAMIFFTKALIISVAEGPGKQNVMGVMNTDYPEINSGTVDLLDADKCRSQLTAALKSSGMGEHLTQQVIRDYEADFMQLIRKEMGISDPPPIN